MREEVFVVGGSQTQFGELWDKSLRDLIDDVIGEALQSTGCLPTDIDAIVIANMVGGEVNEQAHLGALASSLFPHRPPALRVEAACASGGMAIHTACALLESGKAGTVMVIGAEKLTDASSDDVTRAIMHAGDEEKEGACGLTFPGVFGLVAARYMHEYGLSRDDLSRVSAQHHAHAVKNPFAQFRKALTPEQITKSGLIADPLRLLDCSPISDGAATVILSTQKKSPVRIAASQVATDALGLSDRQELTAFRATQIAMDHALQEADLPRTEIDVLELHDCFSIAALIHLEDMGFADRGKGIEMYKEELLPINRSGGLKACGHPIGATGVKQILDCYKQLTGTAPNQVQNARRALAHNIGGSAATCVIHLLERNG